MYVVFLTVKADNIPSKLYKWLGPLVGVKPLHCVVHSDRQWIDYRGDCGFLFHDCVSVRDQVRKRFLYAYKVPDSNNNRIFLEPSASWLSSLVAWLRGDRKYASNCVTKAIGAMMLRGAEWAPPPEVVTPQQLMDWMGVTGYQRLPTASSLFASIDRDAGKGDHAA